MACCKPLLRWHPVCSFSLTQCHFYYKSRSKPPLLTGPVLTALSPCSMLHDPDSIDCMKSPDFRFCESFFNRCAKCYILRDVKWTITKPIRQTEVDWVINHLNRPQPPPPLQQVKSLLQYPVCHGRAHYKCLNSGQKYYIPNSSLVSKFRSIVFLEPRRERSDCVK